MDWGRLMASISARTGWTPEEILRMNLAQLHAYISYWTEQQEAIGDGSTFDDPYMFADVVGIKRVKKEVK